MVDLHNIVIFSRCISGGPASEQGASWRQWSSSHPSLLQQATGILPGIYIKIHKIIGCEELVIRFITTMRYTCTWTKNCNDIIMAYQQIFCSFLFLW